MTETKDNDYKNKENEDIDNKENDHKDNDHKAGVDGRYRAKFLAKACWHFLNILERMRRGNQIYATIII